MTKTVFINIGAKVDGAVAGLRKVKVGVDHLTKADIQKPAKAFESFANKAALAGVGVAFGIGKAVSSFADFDSAMSAASAALPEAGAQMDDLRAQAVELGKATQFSAIEAAQAITELGKAGVETGDILSGGLKGSLDLAAAGQLDVARAAEIAGIATKQFNLTGSDVPHVADLYAAAAGKATGSVDDIAQAMKFAGVTASSMGVSIEETTGVIGLFASKGIIGEQAGTSFRSMLLSLTAPSKLAKTAMDDLGLSVFDGSGQFIGLEGAAEQLRTKLGPLDEATRTAALGQIFGNESIGAAIALYEAGGTGVADWTAKVDDAGFATEQAAKLTDNLKGDVERLSGSLETVFIQAGSGANETLRSMAQGAGLVVDAIGKIPGPALLAGAGLTGIALLLPKGISSYKNYVQQLDTLGISMEKISAKAPRTAKAIGVIGKASLGLTVAATALTVFAEKGQDLGGEQLISGLNKSGDALKAINDRLAETNNEDLGTFTTGVNDLGDVLRFTFDPGVGSQIDSVLDSLLPGELTSDVADATAKLQGLDGVLAQLASSGKGDQAAALMAAITTEAQRQGRSVDEVKAKLPQYTEAVAKAGNESSTAASKVDGLTDSVDDIQQAADDAKTALDDLRTAIVGLGDPAAAQREANRGYAQSLLDVKEGLADTRDEMVKQRLATLGITDPTQKQTTAATKWANAQIAAGKALDLGTEAGIRNQENLDNLADAMQTKIAEDSIAVASTQGLEAATKFAADAATKQREEFIKAAEQMGIGRKKAEELADQLGLVPKDIAIKVSQSGAATATAAIDAAAKDRFATIWVSTHILGLRAATVANQAARVRSDIQDLLGQRAAGGPGGPVFGPGTGTSDTAGLYALSNNEHVLTAEEVAAAGGHGAIFALRKAILTGGVQFRATGGPAVAPPRFVSAPAPSGFGFGIGSSAFASMIGAEVARQIPRALTVVSGSDADTAAQKAIRKDHWRNRHG